MQHSALIHGQADRQLWSVAASARNCPGEFYRSGLIAGVYTRRLCREGRGGLYYGVKADRELVKVSVLLRQDY